MNLRKEDCPTEYMKIRKQLLNLVFKAGPTPVRLASCRELGKRFGVTHMTVARVMKDLGADGYLVIKRGVGTFTNSLNNNVRKSSNVFGVVISDGKCTLFDRIELSFFGAFSDAILRRSQKNWVQNCTLLSPLREADHELLRDNLDGIVWILPGFDAVPVIKELKTKGMPIVSIGRKIEGVSSLSIDFAELGCRIAKRMLEQERKRILLVLMNKPTFPQDMAVDGVEKAFREYGETFHPAWKVKGSSDEQENFGKILERERPDGIIFFDSIRPYLTALKSDQNVTADCLLYSPEWEIRDDMDYSGYVGVPNLKEAANLVAENLEAQLYIPETAEVLEATIAFQIERSASTNLQ